MAKTKMVTGWRELAEGDPYEGSTVSGRVRLADRSWSYIVPLADGREVTVRDKPMVSYELPAVEVRPGDLFIWSWGYDQTNIDFYEVVEVSKSGASVKLKHLRNEIIGAEGTSDVVRPATGPDRFSEGYRQKGLDGWKRLKHGAYRGEAEVHIRIANFRGGEARWVCHGDDIRRLTLEARETNSLFGH